MQPHQNQIPLYPGSPATFTKRGRHTDYPTTNIALSSYYQSRNVFCKQGALWTQLMRKFNSLHILLHLSSYRANQAGITICLPCVVYISHLICRIKDKKRSLRSRMDHAHARMHHKKYFYCMFLFLYHQNLL